MRDFILHVPVNTPHLPCFDRIEFFGQMVRVRLFMEQTSLQDQM